MLDAVVTNKYKFLTSEGQAVVGYNEESMSGNDKLKLLSSGL